MSRKKLTLHLKLGFLSFGGRDNVPTTPQKIDCQHFFLIKLLNIIKNNVSRR